MEKNPGVDPDEPLDPTAAAFGDGLPDPFIRTLRTSAA
jgi:hypothetical protein